MRSNLLALFGGLFCCLLTLGLITQVTIMFLCE